jgi:uncharacterized integral membrane protein
MTDPQSSSIARNPKVIGAAVVAVLALIFVFQNTDKGRVHFLFWTISMPAWIWLLIIFAAGVVVGSLFPWLRRRKKS